MPLLKDASEPKKINFLKENLCFFLEMNKEIPIIIISRPIYPTSIVSGILFAINEARIIAIDPSRIKMDKIFWFFFVLKLTL